MSPLLFYREQAAQQRAAADAATLQNARERCQQASLAWNALAARGERADNSRLQTAADKLLNGINENPDRRSAGVYLLKDVV